MKVKLFAKRDLEAVLNGFLETQDITVHSVAYAIGPKGEREALVLYSDGRALELPAAVRSWLSEQLAERKAS